MVADKDENNAAASTALRFFRNAEGLLVAAMMAIVLWVGSTTYNNSLVLTRLSTQMEILIEGSKDKNNQRDREIERIDDRLDTIWPRLREIKERIQHLESINPDSTRANKPWTH